MTILPDFDGYCTAQGCFEKDTLVFPIVHFWYIGCNKNSVDASIKIRLFLPVCINHVEAAENTIKHFLWPNIITMAKEKSEGFPVDYFDTICSFSRFTRKEFESAESYFRLATMPTKGTA